MSIVAAESAARKSRRRPAAKRLDARIGTVVRALRRRDVVNLYELCEGLETYAVGKAAAWIRPEGESHVPLKYRNSGTSGLEAAMPSDARSIVLSFDIP